MADYASYNSDFRDNELGLPTVQRPESDKDELYHQQWAKGIYSMWYHGKAAIPYSYQDDIDMLRQYGKGTQPISQYLKDYENQSQTASTVDTTDGKSMKFDRDGKNNLDMSIISIAPRVKSMIKAYLRNIREDIVIDTIDPKSGAEQEDKKWRTMLYSMNKDFMEAYQKRAGIPVSQPEFMPETMDELEMYDQAGGFKLAEASSLEKLVQFSMEISEYEDELEDEIYDDLMDLGIGCTKKHLDPEDLKFKDKYVDVKYLVVQHSLKNSFDDIDFVGHTEFYTIGELRKYLPGVEERCFKDVAESYTSRLGNPGEFRAYDTITDAGSWAYDKFLVAVFEAEWKDEENEEAVFYDNRNGKTSKLPVTEETVDKKSDRQRHVKSKLQKLRQCSWVVGTEYTFEWGEVNMQDRPTQNKVISNYHIRALSDSPLVAQLKPVLDDMQVSWLRFQDARSNAAKSGYAVNIAKLKAISDGKDSYNIGEVLRLWKERGLLLYQDSITGKYEGGKTLPVDRLPDTILDELQEFVQTWDHALKRMEDLTGINALILGAAPDPDAPVTTQKLSVASSANAIKPLGLAMNGIKRASAKSFMRRFSLAARARKDIIKSYEGVIGKIAIERLMERGRSMVDYGMWFHPRPTETEKAALMESVNISLQNRREGQPGIDLQTKMYIEEQLYAGVNLKYLRFFVGYMEKKIAREDHARRMELIQAQGKENKEMEAIKGRNQARNQQMKTQGEAAVEAQKIRGGVLEELVKRDDGAAKSMAQKMGLDMSQNPLLESQNQAAQTPSPQSGI